MHYQHARYKQVNVQLLSLFFLLILLTACGSSDDESTSGYFQFYNASSNAPTVYMTLESDDLEKEIAGVPYGYASAQYEYTADNYNLTFGWLNDESSLEEVTTGTVDIVNSAIQLILLAEDITQPQTYVYNIPIEDPEIDEEVFNIRLLNMHSAPEGIDVYLSKSDETFNESVLIEQLAYTEISTGYEYEIENYVFYITLANSDDVLFKSESIPFHYTSQYIFVVRENESNSASNFTLDKLGSSSGITSYNDEEADAELRVYNGLQNNALFTAYYDDFDLHLNEIGGSPLIRGLSYGEFSNSFQLPFGDYSVDLTATDDTVAFTKNHLLTLPANADKTALFYFYEQTEEHEDGSEDTTVFVNSLVVDNSNRYSYYDHSVKVINLIDDFTLIDIYFVRSNETVETAAYNLQSRFVTPQDIALLNNTYTVYAIGKENNNELVLSTELLTINETSGDLFLILEESQQAPSGYKISFSSQSNEIDSTETESFETGSSDTDN